MNYPRGGRKTQENGNRIYADISKYYWTHRRCNYSVDECRFKAEGHKENKMYNNKWKKKSKV